MPGMGQAIYDNGVSQGIIQGIQQGIDQEKIDTLERVTQNYMKQDPTLTREEAEKKAKAILS